jgi:hypothetical protein
MPFLLFSYFCASKPISTFYRSLGRVSRHAGRVRAELKAGFFGKASSCQLFKHDAGRAGSLKASVKTM